MASDLSEKDLDALADAGIDGNLLLYLKKRASVKILKNEDIIDMSLAGIPPADIITSIRENKNEFKTKSGDIRRLARKGNVPASVVMAMKGQPLGFKDLLELAENDIALDEYISLLDFVGYENRSLSPRKALSLSEQGVPMDVIARIRKAETVTPEAQAAAGQPVQEQLQVRSEPLVELEGSAENPAAIIMSGTEKAEEPSLILSPERHRRTAETKKQQPEQTVSSPEGSAAENAEEQPARVSKTRAAALSLPDEIPVFGITQPSKDTKQQGSALDNPFIYSTGTIPEYLCGSWLAEILDSNGFPEAQITVRFRSSGNFSSYSVSGVREKSASGVFRITKDSIRGRNEQSRNFEYPYHMEGSRLVITMPGVKQPLIFRKEIQ